MGEVKWSSISTYLLVPEFLSEDILLFFSLASSFLATVVSGFLDFSSLVVTLRTGSSMTRLWGSVDPLEISLELGFRSSAGLRDLSRTRLYEESESGRSSVEISRLIFFIPGLELDCPTAGSSFLFFRSSPDTKQYLIYISSILVFKYSIIILWSRNYCVGYPAYRKGRIDVRHKLKISNRKLLPTCNIVFLSIQVTKNPCILHLSILISWYHDILVYPSIS